MAGGIKAAAERARIAIGAVFFVNGAAVGSWVPHIPDRARALRLDPAHLGATLLASGIGCMLAMPLSGALIGRFGSRRVSVTAGLLFPACIALAVAAPTTPLLATALFCAGMAGASNDVAMNAHGVSVERALGRPAISLFHALFSVGAVAGAAVTSAALERHAQPVLLASVVAGMLIAIVLLAAGNLLKEDAPGRQGSHRGAAVEGARSAVAGGTRPTLWPRIRASVPHGRLLLLGVLTFCALVSEGAVADWGGLLLRATHGLAGGRVGYGYAAFSATMVAGRFTGDLLVGRVGEVGALRLGGCVSGAGLLLALSSPMVDGALLGFALAGLGLANASPILYRAAGRLPGYAPEHALAVAVGVGYAGLLAGPPVLGFVAQGWGFRSIFYILAALSGVLALAAHLVSRAAGPVKPKADKPGSGAHSSQPAVPSAAGSSSFKVEETART